MVECEYGRKSYFGGSGAYTRQRTTRGLSSKRRKVADGSPRTGASLHLKSSDLMGVEYECVDGGPPAGAAKLRSGTFALLKLELVELSVFMGSGAGDERGGADGCRVGRSERVGVRKRREWIWV